MEKRKIGRPKKINAVKPGELNKDECRFTFITTVKNVDQIKKGAKEEELKIKEYLNQVLHFYWYNKKSKNKYEKFLILHMRHKMKKQ
jgi:hypothetical protein